MASEGDSAMWLRVEDEDIDEAKLLRVTVNENTTGNGKKRRTSFVCKGSLYKSRTSFVCKGSSGRRSWGMRSSAGRRRAERSPAGRASTWGWSTECRCPPMPRAVGGRPPTAYGPKRKRALFSYKKRADLALSR